MNSGRNHPTTNQQNAGVQALDVDYYKKLRNVMQYLWGIREMRLTIKPATILIGGLAVCTWYTQK